MFASIQVDVEAEKKKKYKMLWISDYVIVNKILSPVYQFIHYSSNISEYVLYAKSNIIH